MEFETEGKIEHLTTSNWRLSSLPSVTETKNSVNQFDLTNVYIDGHCTQNFGLQILFKHT